MTKTQEIPAEIMQEADRLYRLSHDPMSFEPVEAIARALLARDTAARKECAEIARRAKDRQMLVRQMQTALSIAAAIEASIGGGDV